MKTKKQLVAVFDIDGVLADFEGKFCEDFGNANRYLYDLCARYPEVDPELIKEWVLNPETYRDLEPIFGGINLLNGFKSRGCHILLATSRDKSLSKVTTDWLNKFFINYDEILFGKNKVELLKSYQHMNANKKIIVAIDDSVEVLKQLKNNFKFPCVRWWQLWNANGGGYPVAWYEGKTFTHGISFDGFTHHLFWSNKK